MDEQRENKDRPVSLRDLFDVVEARELFRLNRLEWLSLALGVMAMIFSFFYISQLWPFLIAGSILFAAGVIGAAIKSQK